MGTEQYRRKLVKHVHEPGHLHEMTFSCQQRRQLLWKHSRLKELSKFLDLAGEKTSIELVAFVFMPEHVHLLVFPTTDDPNLGLYLALLKQPFSKFVKEQLTEKKSPLLEELTIVDRRGKSIFRFWQVGSGYDRNLYSTGAILASLDYFHNNPVRRGLCKRAIDWKWSSARFYHGEPPGMQHPDLPRVHGLPAGVL